MAKMIAYCDDCGAEVDWVKGSRAAQILGVTDGRVRQMIVAGQFPGIVKYHPPGRERPFWKIPVASLAAVMEARRSE